MEEEIPGLIPNESTQVIYLQIPHGRNPEEVFNEVLPAWKPIVVSRGTAILGNWELVTSDGLKFVPIECLVDPAGWAKQIELGASLMKLQIGSIEGEFFQIFNGSEYSLKKCLLTRVSNTRSI